MKTHTQHPSPLPAAQAGTVSLSLTLGETLQVNRIGFGAMRLTGANVWGDPPDVELAQRVLRRAVELGVNFIDTADSYGPEVNEALIARTLHPYPRGLIIATKGGLTRPAPERWERNARPEHLRAACEGSLRRLKVECIDLYQLHAPDPAVPFEESVGELTRLQREGKIRCIGLSNVNEDELQRARRLTPIASVQNRYNIVERTHEAVLDQCASAGIAFIPWDPLGGVRQAAPIAELDRIVSEFQVTANQAALAWLLARSPVMLPIPGTSSLEHLEQNVAAAALSARLRTDSPG